MTFKKYIIVLLGVVLIMLFNTLAYNLLEVDNRAFLIYTNIIVAFLTAQGLTAYARIYDMQKGK